MRTTTNTDYRTEIRHRFHLKFHNRITHETGNATSVSSRKMLTVFSMMGMSVMNKKRSETSITSSDSGKTHQYLRTKRFIRYNLYFKIH